MILSHCVFSCSGSKCSLSEFIDFFRDCCYKLQKVSSFDIELCFSPDLPHFLICVPFSSSSFMCGELRCFRSSSSRKYFSVPFQGPKSLSYQIDLWLSRCVSDSSSVWYVS